MKTFCPGNGSCGSTGCRCDQSEPFTLEDLKDLHKKAHGHPVQEDEGKKCAKCGEGQFGKNIALGCDDPWHCRECGGEREPFRHPCQSCQTCRLHHYPKPCKVCSPTPTSPEDWEARFLHFITDEFCATRKPKQAGETHMWFFCHEVPCLGQDVADDCACCLTDPKEWGDCGCDCHFRLNQLKSFIRAERERVLDAVMVEEKTDEIRKSGDILDEEAGNADDVAYASRVAGRIEGWNAASAEMKRRREGL